MCFRMFTFWMAKTFLVQYKRKIIINLFNISFYWRNYCKPSEASPMKFTSFSRTVHWLIVHVKQWSCFIVRNPNSLLPTCGRPTACTRVGHGSLFKIWGWLGWDPTQPKISGHNPTHKSLHPTQPTHHRHLVGYGILDYTENFIQQLLHVTDKFTVNESYYSAAVLINRQ